jgi:hypothetical protein
MLFSLALWRYISLRVSNVAVVEEAARHYSTKEIIGQLRDQQAGKDRHSW